MPKNVPINEVPERDRLMTRPDPEPLPTTLDPASPDARGGTADPRPVPTHGQYKPDDQTPAPDDIDRTA